MYLYFTASETCSAFAGGTAVFDFNFLEDFTSATATPPFVFTIHAPGTYAEAWVGEAAGEAPTTHGYAPRLDRRRRVYATLT